MVVGSIVGDLLERIVAVGAVTPGNAGKDANQQSLQHQKVYSRHNYRTSSSSHCAVHHQLCCC